MVEFQRHAAKQMYYGRIFCSTTLDHSLVQLCWNFLFLFPWTLFWYIISTPAHESSFKS